MEDTVTVVAEVSILSEAVTFVRDAELPPSGLLVPTSGDVLSGKFTWKVSHKSALCALQDPHRTPALL